MGRSFTIVAALALLSSTLAGVTAVEPLRQKGLVAAVQSPMTDDGMTLNYTVVPLQAEYLQSTGVNRVFIAGTTGESLSLTLDERLQLVETWEQATQADGMDVDYIVHIGAEAIGDVVTLAKHAEKHGAVAVGLMPPVFFKPPTVTNLGAWIETAANACPSLPTYYYHIPSMTGVEFEMIDLVKEMDRRGVENFAGVKYTGLYETRAFPDAMRCAAYKGGKYDILSGREELMIESLAAGIEGFIGSQFNYGGDIYNAIYSETDSTKRNALQLASIELLYVWLENVPSTIDGNKLMVNLAGVPIGPARLPMLPPSDEDIATLKTAVQGWCGEYAGIFDNGVAICRAVGSAVVVE